MSLDLNETFYGDTPSDDWHEYAEGVEMRISRLDNAQYQVGIERFRRYADRQTAKLFAADGSLSDDALVVSGNDKTEYQVQAQLLAKYLLLDWKGVTESGEEVVYTPERGYKLLLNQPKVFAWVLSCANKMKVAKEAEEAETLEK